ncbi:MAG: S8/S53 family peptidase [Actinomycetota bacterium]|nr:S8/S53 family peptidase [Actinomycetota bacterium]
MRLPVRPLPLAALMLAVPVALGVLPGASAAPPEGKGPGACKPAKKCEPAPEPTTAAPRVVVADVDSGVNPYHDAYYAHGPSEVTPDVLAEFPGIETVRLTRTGDFAADFAADKPFWDSVRNGKPYWFEGTNLIGVSFDTSGVKIFSDPRDEHGTGTSAAVLAANPEAVVVMVEGINAQSETFAFTHPAVDIVTTSYGFPGSPPIPFHLENSYEGTVKRGKMHFGASDNSPALSPPDGTSGPWWSVAVAGFHEDTTGGRETLSGNVIDFVSDFTQTLPYCSDCETGTRAVSGTSFATPRSAGTASAVLLEARRGAGHVGGPVVKDGTGSLAVQGGALSLTPWQLRRALEEAAHYPGLADYKGLGTRHTPVVDQAPYVQTGWGILSPDAKYGVVEQALAQLGLRDGARKAKGGAACDWNNAQHDARHAYWDSVAVGSESFLTTDKEPFVHC